MYWCLVMIFLSIISLIFLVLIGIGTLVIRFDIIGTYENSIISCWLLCYMFHSQVFLKGSKCVPNQSPKNRYIIFFVILQSQPHSL